MKKMNWFSTTGYWALKITRENRNWNVISGYKVLSENFMREFQDKIDWDLISGYQAISENFIIKNDQRNDFLLRDSSIYFK